MSKLSSANTNGTKQLINLTSSSNHANMLFATDEWFATCENLLNPTPPIFIPDLFCDQGKVMDGWETRRKRIAGHDWCIIKLASGLDDERTGRVHDRSFTISTIQLDTGYFTGNQVPRVSIEGMKVTRPYTKDDNALEHDNEDYLYAWLPGAATRLSRGGKGIRGTGQSPSTVIHALEACQEVARRTIPNNPNGDWITILPMLHLKPGYEESRYHTFEVLDDVKKKIAEMSGITHLRLNYYPDGGVARLNVYGSLFNTDVVEEKLQVNSTIDGNNAPIVHPHSSYDRAPSTLPHPFPELSSEVHGGLGLACSNKHYGIPQNLLRQYPGKDMGDGWETARHPNRPATVSKDPITGLQITPLNDWCVIKLGLGGAEQNEGISRVIVDTRHFKGNFPESVTIDACYSDPKRVSDDEVCKSAGEDDTTKQSSSSIKWFPLLKRTLLKADAEHEFVSENGHLVNERQDITHIRISITPDGGLSRVRVYGSPLQKPVEHINSHL